MPRVVQTRRPRHRVLATGSQILAAKKISFASGVSGLYRVFNAAGYRFYRSTAGAPNVGDVPFATNATLPFTPADTFSDGTWYVSVSYFNGILDSGFLPLGSGGETFVRLDILAGESITAPPAGPTFWRLEHIGSGVVRVYGTYLERGSLRATEWALAFTTNGSDPAIDTPDVTQSFRTRGGVSLAYDLPAQSNGVTVKARLQMRRLDSSYRYSENSTIETLVVDTVGPAAAQGGG